MMAVIDAMKVFIVSHISALPFGSTTCRTVISHSAAPRDFKLSVGAFVGTRSNLRVRNYVLSIT